MFESVEAFHRPASIREALRLLHNGRGRARFVAGGTDVVLQADPSVRFLVDISQLGLNYVRRTGGGWTIGAATTLSALEDSPAVRKLAGGILSRACGACGTVQIRNMASLGGKLIRPAEPAAALLALDATVVLAGPKGRRKIPICDFFAIPVESALVVEIAIPALPRARWSFQKLARTGNDISLVDVAAGLQVDRRGVIQRARIALGSVAPKPMRAIHAENLLIGRKPDAGVLAQACEEVAREIRPIDDIRASAEYRREMSRVLARRALEECL